MLIASNFMLVASNFMPIASYYMLIASLLTTFECSAALGLLLGKIPPLEAWICAHLLRILISLRMRFRM